MFKCWCCRGTGWWDTSLGPFKCNKCDYWKPKPPDHNFFTLANAKMRRVKR